MLAEITWNQNTLAVVGVFSIPIVGILPQTWFKAEQVRAITNLKREMVARGMSVDEIERVIKAGPPVRS